jgi:hypothetical protein
VAELSAHSRHDRFSIAAALGGGSLPTSVRACPACGALHRDLVSIQSALRLVALPRRPRDLRLTSADLERLRPALWRRFLAAIGSSRDSVTRPLALGFTGLGICGLLLTNLPLGSAGGMAISATPYEVDIASRPVLGEDTPIAIEETPDPTTVISIGSITIGGALFALRRIATRTKRMR